MLDHAAYAELEAHLGSAGARPEAPYIRAPIHTLSVPADFFGPGVLREYGRLVRRTVAEHGPLPFDPEITARVLEKLDREPVEDVRIDFADSYGTRDDAEEDAAAVRAATALRTGDSPPFFGLRCKGLSSPESRRRAARTVDIFLETLGPPPPGFVITLPGVTTAAQVEAMVVLCGRLEQAHGLADGTLSFELQLDSPVDAGPLLAATAGRCVAVVHGAAGYANSLGIAAAFATLDHPAADHARARLQVAVAGTSIRLVDGASGAVPVGDTDAVQAAWTDHARLVRRALEQGIYCGWDANPAQLPTRFGATYGFFHAAAPTALDLLGRYLPRPGSADPTILQGLARLLLRGFDCGALDESTVEFDRATLEGLWSPPGRPT